MKNRIVVYTKPYLVKGWIMAFHDSDMNEDSFIGLFQSVSAAEKFAHRE